MRSNTFNLLQICLSVLLSDFIATQDGYTGLRGSVIKVILRVYGSKKPHYGFILHRFPSSQVPGSVE